MLIKKLCTTLYKSVISKYFSTRFYTFFSADENTKATRRGEDLKLVFNIDSINNALEKNNFMKLTQFQMFLMNGHRSITVVHFISKKEVHEFSVMKGKTGTIIREKFKHNSVVDCIEILEESKNLILNRLNDEVQRLSSNTPSPYPDFKIVKYFCVNMSVMHTPNGLSSIVHLENLDQNESVIIVNWRGMSAQTVMVDTAKGNHPNNRIAMDSACKAKKLSKQDNHGFLKHSQLVMSTTKDFLRNKGIDETDYIAVHVRSEKLGLREARLHGSFKLCLDKLSSTVDDLAATKNLSVVYITDYGPYSSDTCRQCKSGIQISGWMKERGIEEVKFDPLSVNLPPDSGFAAAVETNVLASAKYLIVCGGGAFQTQVITNFHALHRMNYSHTDPSSRSLHSVCTDDSSTPTH